MSPSKSESKIGKGRPLFRIFYTVREQDVSSNTLDYPYRRSQVSEKREERRRTGGLLSQLFRLTKKKLLEENL